MDTVCNTRYTYCILWKLLTEAVTVCKMENLQLWDLLQTLFAISGFLNLPNRKETRLNVRQYSCWLHSTGIARSHTTGVAS